MEKERLKKFAELIANVGGNVKTDDEVIIYAELDQPEFVEMVAEACYKRGAKKISIEWNHTPISKLSAIYQSLETMSEVPSWQEEKWKGQAETLPVKIYLLSEDPDGMVGIDQSKYSAATQARYKVIKPYRDKMDSKYKWCIAAVAGEKWAKKVFPEEEPEKAVEKLWEAILFTSRVTENPEEEWARHNAELKEKCDKLNRLHIKKLHYTASNGTDLTVGLIPDALFMGGGETTLSGEYFNANIPSEEIFTTPMRGSAEGIVYSSKPLCYRGELIDNFSIRFKNGKVCEVKAEKNESLLKELVSMDDGAAFLGECALVPYSSPIRESGVLFYNTLFDENAACHLALGEGFANCIKDFEKYSLDECRKKGINESVIHEDFMIGTADLCITAETETQGEVKIFENGNWAI